MRFPTDLTFKVVAVTPEGRAFDIRDSIPQVRCRTDFAQPELMQAGDAYKMCNGPFLPSNDFEPGHCTPVEVASSNFSGVERNLISGGNNAQEVSGRIARNTERHRPDRPSRVMLPVIAL